MSKTQKEKIPTIVFWFQGVKYRFYIEGKNKPDPMTDDVDEIMAILQTALSDIEIELKQDKGKSIWEIIGVPFEDRGKISFP